MKFQLPKILPYRISVIARVMYMTDLIVKLSIICFALFFYHSYYDKVFTYKLICVIIKEGVDAEEESIKEDFDAEKVSIKGELDTGKESIKEEVDPGEEFIDKGYNAVEESVEGKNMEVGFWCFKTFRFVC